MGISKKKKQKKKFYDLRASKYRSSSQEDLNTLTLVV